MKKIVIALLLTSLVMMSNFASAGEYIMCPGDQLDIVVIGNEDITTRLLLEVNI